ncbi:MAG: hypothetical protein CMG71_04930 [Candidatus Marinimicrobia bacterium]|nr:hypothetical protein [Candidatus Neomarinimicrobiota bacterium]|tara:strand:- start:2371 stop:2538 length:168 start_codon:yes stop_codon:yes gene_type:complete
MKKIPKKEALIIENYFEIDMNCPHTLEEIGDELAHTIERVRQLKERAQTLPVPKC